jgi:NAD(P) transhydrogenase
MIGCLDLTLLGIESDTRGKIRVNKNFQTDISNVYAVGDVIGSPALAATSHEQGRSAARHAFGLENSRPAELLPIGIYTIPEISMVGSTETELKERSIPYEVGIGMYGDTARGKILGDSSGKLKLIFNSINRNLLGVHIIGEGASELVHIGQLGLAMGTKLDYFVDNVFNYPTLAECYRIAALDALNKLS